MLTREQLLASSDDQYMNRAQLDFFRSLLLQEKAAIEESVALAHADLAVQESAADPADRASQEEARVTLLRTRERETNLLHKIEATLLRIDALRQRVDLRAIADLSSYATRAIQQSLACLKS